MKAITYIIAIVAIAAAGWFSYDSMNKFKDLQTARKQLDSENETRKKNIKKAGKEADEVEDALKTAKQELAELESSRDNTNNNADLAKKQAATWSSKIAGQKERLQEIQDLIVQIKKNFASEVGDDVELDEIPGLISKLEGDLQQANKDLEELNTNVEVADRRASSSETQITDLNERVSRRASRIKSNALQGRVSAVNHDWGFVTVSIPSNMPVTSASKLIIKRGSAYVGNLKINAIEGTRIIADIDYKTLAPGMVIQSGDAVVLSKPVTN